MRKRIFCWTELKKYAQRIEGLGNIRFAKQHMLIERNGRHVRGCAYAKTVLDHLHFDRAIMDQLIAQQLKNCAAQRYRCRKGEYYSGELTQRTKLGYRDRDQKQQAERQVNTSASCATVTHA